eukprot:TRINITY_DN45_c0_g1_i2.p2 TRINITY_DN45_c0_g1~~TRINITY_DN45_c0_g1_i2.p2  ORF type:complete len:393 (+),score=64.64 TRINITY_DN45_c0_g1_i2:956-2134(+)
MAFVPPLPLFQRSSFPAANNRIQPRHGLKHASRQCTTQKAIPPRMIQSEVKQATPTLDWKNLGFQYIQTACFVKCVWKDGEWSSPSVETEPFIRMHIASTALHYGQSCFEGLKAFRGQDDVVRIFRADENAKRLHASAERLVIPPVPEELFLHVVHMAIRENIEYVPPYGSGGSLYIRPLLYGSGAKIGVQSSDEFTFLVMVVPVGDYYKGGLSPVTAFVIEKFDRAAPNGVGHVKVAGNYAADLLPSTMSKEAGYPISLYLDAQNHQTIEEFGTSNFFGLKGNSYVTPNSSSVLQSITNKTLMQLAEDEGMVVERREIDIDELEEFDEVGACGTAVVITAVSRVVHGSKVYEIGNDPRSVGKGILRLYKKVRAIQYGEQPDLHGWTQPLVM